MPNPNTRKKAFYNLFGMKFKVFPEADENTIILVNESAIKEETEKGYPLPEAIKRTKQYHGKINL